jgi:hypothetical protein
MADFATARAELASTPPVANREAQQLITNVLQQAQNGPSLGSVIEAQRAISALMGDRSAGATRARAALYGYEIAARNSQPWYNRPSAELGWLFNRTTW